MRVKIVGFGHFVTETRFKFEGAFAKNLKVGDVIGYLDRFQQCSVQRPSVTILGLATAVRGGHLQLDHGWNSAQSKAAANIG